MSAPSGPHPGQDQPAKRKLENVLVYSKPSWYVHTTLSATNHWLLHFGWDTGVNIDETDDPEKEEWLCYNRPVTGQAGVKVLARLDESTFVPVREKFAVHVEPMGVDHPAIWTRETEGGRFFYTAIGHGVRALNSEFGRHHLLEGLRWAAGETE